MKTKINRGFENKFYIGLVAVLITLFGVFFTSKMWMYDDSPVAQTPFNKKLSGLQQTDIRLSKWQYNPQEQLMEVTLETKHSGGDVIKPTLSFEAKAKDSKEEYLVDVVYQDDRNTVVQIKDVPEKFDVVGLFVIEKRDESVLESEYKERLMEDTVSSNQDVEQIEIDYPKPEEIVIVGDYRKIKLNNSLFTKSDNEYKKENIVVEIEQIKDKVAFIMNEKLPLQDEMVRSLQTDIEALKDDMEYQTNDEKNDTEQEIKQKKGAIQKAKEEKDELQKTVKELKEKYERRKDRLNNVDNNVDQNKQQNVKNSDKKKDAS